MTQVYDITIIGAGPVGLFAAFYGGLRNASIKIIDSLPEVGGQPAFLYPEKMIFDIPSQLAISGGQLIASQLKQLERFHPTLCLGEEALALTKNENHIFEIQTNKNLHYSKTVIIACGNGAFKPRTLGLPLEEDFKDTSLFYHVQNIQKFSGQTVAICGGGDSAVDWALSLEPVAKKVHIIHRRDQFRAHEHSVHLLRESSVSIHTPYVPTSLIGKHKQLERVILKEARGEKVLELDVDAFIISYGFSSSLGQIKDWPLDIERNRILVNGQMETSLPGVFAIGDIVSYPGRVDLISTGYGEAPLAVHHALSYIHPNEKIQAVHSSSLL